MVKSKIQNLENELRKRTSRFLNDTVRHSSVAAVLDIIREKKWQAFLCGGALRDILLNKKILPRDLDIIVRYVSEEELERTFSCFELKHTRFGGISILVKDWKVDIWPLSRTWAFREKIVHFNAGFCDFVNTTFLDIDAIAVQLHTARGEKRTIYSKGFFEAVINRTIEINLQDNPAPKLCLAKVLYLSERYQFNIGQRLDRYLRGFDLTEIRMIAEKMYGAKYFFEQMDQNKLPGKNLQGNRVCENMTKLFKQHALF